MADTNITLNIGATQAVQIIVALFVAFLGIAGTIVTLAWQGSGRFSAIETSLAWIKEDLVWIKEDLTRLWTTIQGKEARQQELEVPGSPLNPTAKGAKWLAESGLQDIIDGEHRQALLRRLKAALPPNNAEYDVQEKAGEVLLSLADDAMMHKVKDYSFQNGLEYDLILRLGRLLLRDNFLGWKHSIVPDKPKE